MLSRRGFHKSGLKKMFRRKKTIIEAPPLCSTHRCELTDFECNTWSLVACRRCINLKNTKIERRCGLRKEAMHRSSDLIFKILADDDDEGLILVKDDETDQSGEKDTHDFHQRFSVPTMPGGNNNNVKKSDKLFDEFNQLHINKNNFLEECEEQALPQSPEKSVEGQRNAQRSRTTATFVRPSTFIHCASLENDEELSVRGLLGQIIQDVCGKGNETLVSEYLDFAKKACEDDPSLGYVRGKELSSGEERIPEPNDKLDTPPVGATTKSADKCDQKSRQSFTALLHLGYHGEQEQLLSVHGLLGRVLQNLYEKPHDSESRYSRPVSIAEYITLVKKACEADPSLGSIEEIPSTVLP